MRIVHWNLHHGGLGINSDGSNEKLEPQRISDWLVKFNPDYVCLNELEQLDGYGNSDQLELHRSNLSKATSLPWYSAFCGESGGSANKGNGNGILSKFPLNTIERKALTGSRSAMYAKALFGIQGSVGSLFTTHLDNVSQGNRVVESALLSCWMSQHPDPVILCGDLNAQPTTLELAVFNSQYKDAWVEATKLKTATSFKPNGITHGSHRIDFIYYHNLTIQSVDVPDTSVNGVFPSDHHPVIAVFA
jgi:endonuclease/exonuclease/phosphatase family metal-dependent hydrolase